MSDNFVTYEQALALKGLGFDDTLKLFMYDSKGNFTNKWGIGNISAPFRYQVLRWFREKYDLDIYISRMLPKSTTGKYYAVVNDKWAPNDPHDSYEEAENGLIDSLIGMAKLQQKDEK